ncbi:MAG: EamA family transporter [Bacteroidota bacterium]|jgi:drug/metabolite transporter (DMT)-like permease
MLTLILLVCSQAAYGLTNCLWKIKGRSISSWWLMANRSLITFPAFLLILYFAGAGTPWNDTQWLYALWALPLSLVGLVCFVRSVRSGFVSKSVPLLAFISFWGVVSSVFFFNHSFEYEFLYPTVVLAAGFVLISRRDLLEMEFDRGMVLAMLAAFCWGITIPAFSEMSKGDAFWKLSAIQEGMVLIVSAIAYWFRPVGDLRMNKGLELPVLIGFLTVAGVGGTNYVLGQVSPLIFSLLCLTQPAVSLMVAYFKLGERLTKWQWMGTIMLMLGSIWLVSLR